MTQTKPQAMTREQIKSAGFTRGWRYAVLTRTTQRAIEIPSGRRFNIQNRPD